MSVVFVFIHTLAAILLIVVILMQSGRGGGLTEGFAPAESLFGAKTNQFMVKATATLALVFLVTCLSLAYMNAQRTSSLIPEDPQETGDTAAQEIPAEVSAEPDASQTSDAQPAAGGPVSAVEQVPAAGYAPEPAAEPQPE